LVIANFVLASHTIVGFVCGRKPNTLSKGSRIMNNLLLKLYIQLQNLASRDEGQDLVEYALVVALVAFGATAGMKVLAAGLTLAFRGISTTLGSYVS